MLRSRAVQHKATGQRTEDPEPQRTQRTQRNSTTESIGDGEFEGDGQSPGPACAESKPLLRALAVASGLHSSVFSVFSVVQVLPLHGRIVASRARRARESSNLRAPDSRSSQSHLSGRDRGPIEPLESRLAVRIPPEVHAVLPAIEIETGPKPTATVIWLHGLGDDGNGWSQVVPSLGLPSRLAIRFLFPHAPTMPVSINNGYVMRAWYDIREANLNERADLDGVRRSQAAVEAMIAHEKARGIAASRIVLAGFSQGGAIALYAGLRHRERLAGIVALSTYLIDAPRARGRGRARQPRRADLHGARHARSRRAHRVGRAVAAGARRGGLARRMATPTRWSTPRCSRKSSPSARSCSGCWAPQARARARPRRFDRGSAPSGSPHGAVSRGGPPARRRCPCGRPSGARRPRARPRASASPGGIPAPRRSPGRGETTVCSAETTPSATTRFCSACAIEMIAPVIAAELLSDRQVLDERAVDLDDVHGKALEIGERRITGAEVVERDAHAAGAQLAEHAFDRGRRVEQQALGDLDLERGAAHARLAQHLAQRSRRSAAA